jgi:hypothetical protein
VLVTSSADFFSHLPLQTTPIPTAARAWTDDYSNLWQALR